ncbi:hypothetical protein J2X66_005971 [Pseudomonas sp. 3296]|uniref:hypothetical protein n=1 Tax=Pseudomonas sp. 3296 TaxID=2817753 RepID=UPI00285C50F2|nr:hypothetical protein [Pseudomonas sp. 3296]MDR6919066.1 hypothetical protein [Pseudomonas sp. 3296]
MKERSYLLIGCVVSSLMLGCSNAVYPDPTPEATEHLTSTPVKNAKEISSVQWMNNDFSEDIKSATAGEDVGLLIKTKGYAQGEQVTVVFEEKRFNDDGGSYVIERKIVGRVNDYGEIKALIKFSGVVSARAN